MTKNNKEYSFDNFNEKVYLELYPDVANAIKNGTCKSGFDHYKDFGFKEGRAASLGAQNSIVFNERKENTKTKRSTIASHQNLWQWIASIGNKRDFCVLEIGSRSVVSDALWKKVIPNCEYTGFDVMQGKNVDVVGDAHRLSDYFPNEKFDLIISFAVFEHLAMPWIVAEEMAKLIKTGGHVAVETHFSYSEHELPWHFFQFNSNALEVLFNQELGFELVDSGLDNPIVGKFSNVSDDYLAGKEVTDLFCHSSIIVKMNKQLSSPEFSWQDVSDRLIKSSMYPESSGMK